MQYGIVYLWYDKVKTKFYIGSHWGTEDDGYICSSAYMKRAYNKRPQDFKRRILTKVFEKEKLLEEEYKWLSKIKEEELGKRYYNFNNHHPGHWFISENCTQIRKTISESVKQAFTRPEIREKYLEAIKNRNTRSSEPEVREKRRKSMIKTIEEKFPVENRYNPVEFGSQEYRENMAISASLKWQKLSEEERKEIGYKISNSLSGKSKTGNAAKGHKKTLERNKKASISIKEVLRLNPDKTTKSKYWWNNGTQNTRSIDSPGEGWVKGKLPHNKSYNSDTMKEIWAKRKAGILLTPNYNKE